MKKILFALLTVTSLNATAQTDEGVFFDFNFGGRFSGAASDTVSMGPGLHFEGATGYMFSNLFGIRGVLGYDQFSTSVKGANPEVIDRSYMLRANLDAVVSISEIAGFGTAEFGMNFHAGFGIASQFNPSWKEDRKAAGVEFNDPFLKGNDDMFNVSMGLNPKYHINENLSINADISYILLLKRDVTVDTYNNVKVEGMDGILNGSIGLTYRL